jgi:hypothetical protein
MADADAGRPIGRVRFMDAQRVNLDGFATEDAGLGMVAYSSPSDPAPSLTVREGRVVEMDGKTWTSTSPVRRWRSTTWPTRGCWSTRPCRALSWCGWPPG